MLLRAIDAKFWGVVAMGGTVVILFFLPWLDHSPVKSIRYRPTWHKWIYGIFMVNFLVLGYIGTQPPSPPLNLTSQIGTLLYLAFFFLMPVWSRLGTFARARARHVPAPLSPRDNGPTMIKKLIGAVALMMLTCTAISPRRAASPGKSPVPRQ